ncbi:MAG: hypothetical protein E7291_03185 [Lachnospiraceae bacterium]|nr:hypothetical protein [Lachnospiraceae bacterium]
MIDWERIIKAEKVDELRNAKLWLFQENMRLENERSEFIQSRDKFIRERVKFRDEMDTLNRRTVLERKRLKEENLFFEKKMAILQDGFRKLEEERRSFEREKRFLREEIARQQEVPKDISVNDVAEVLFRSVNNPLALRKRYRDLVKIFHPDNLFGDEELAQQINREFVRRRKEEW